MYKNKKKPGSVHFLDNEQRPLEVEGDEKSPSPSMSSVSCPEQYADLTHTLQRLENDKDSLSLQVSVLSEQVGAQTEKIKDLEELLQDKGEKLDNTEDLLQEEMVTRCSLETSKLDLMGQISRLKLQCAGMDREKGDIEARLMGAQHEIDQVQQNITDYPSLSRYQRPPLPPYQRPTILDPGAEIASLRAAVQQLIMTNDYNNATSRALSQNVFDQPKTSIYNQSEVCLPVPVPTPVDNVDEDINVRIRQLLNIPVGVSEPAAQGSLSSHSMTSFLSSPTTYSTPPSLHSPWSEYKPPNFQYASTPTYKPPVYQSPGQQLAAELDQLAQRYPMAVGLSPTGSMPRSFASNGSMRSSIRKKFSSGSNNHLAVPEPSRKKAHSPSPFRGLKWLSQTLRRAKRSTSAPNLAFTDDELLATRRAWDEEILMKNDKEKEKKSNIFSLISNKLHRTSSPSVGHSTLNRSSHSRTSVSGGSISNFWMSPSSSCFARPPVEMFAGWSNAQCREWLSTIGLDMYDQQASTVVQSGRHLLTMTNSEMHKDLCMHHPLHRKKLNLALRAIEGNTHEAQDTMDYHQVLRWLDDIGLPQYRDVFADARIDGQVLNMLTVDDLLHMKVVSAMHHASLCRGIQMLRLVAFNLNRLERKLDMQGVGECASPWKVQMWSQHCVSQWLHMIDLTEFSPNLMCAGIHGALMSAKKSFSSHSRRSAHDIYKQPTDMLCPIRAIQYSDAVLQEAQYQRHLSESVLQGLPASNV